MLEMLLYFCLISTVCLGLVVLEDRITEHRGDRRWDHVESALGRGFRVTVSIDCGGALPFRCEVEGRVFGFASWVLCADFLWLLADGRGVSEAVSECEGVLLSHPSIRGGLPG